MGQAIVFLIGAAVVAGALYLAAPHYQVVMGENQTIVWRLDTHTGALAVCTSPDLPGAGCRSVPEPQPTKADSKPESQGSPAAQR
jgi:hypothetical protein